MLVRVEELNERPVAGAPLPHLRQPGARQRGRRGRASPGSPATSPVPRRSSRRRCRRCAEPGLRRHRTSTVRPDGHVDEREAFIRQAYEEADDDPARSRGSSWARTPTTFVSSDHGFAPRFSSSTPARCSSISGCCRIRRPRTAAPPPVRRSARRRRAGSVVRGDGVLLNLAGRDPVGGGFRRWRRPTRRRPSQRS